MKLGKPSMKSSTMLLVALCLSFIVFAAIDQFLPSQHWRASHLIHAICIGALCYSWCRLEARERDTIPPGRSALWAGLVPFIGVPIYLFRTRGAKRGAIGSAKALILLFALAGCAIVTEQLIRTARG